VIVVERRNVGNASISITMLLASSHAIPASETTPLALHVPTLGANAPYCNRQTNSPSRTAPSAYSCRQAFK